VVKPPGPGRLAVSIPPSCIKLFDAVEVTPAIDAACIRSSGNTVWWGSDEPRVEYFQPGLRGWQADLHELSKVMLAHAASNQQLRVTTNAGNAAGPQLVLDCTGRAGVLAKEKGVRHYDDGPKTVALVGEWRTGTSWAVPDDTHTVIESYRDGWMWSVPTAPGVRHVSAMVDPQRSGLARGSAARQIYLAEIAKTTQFKRLLDDASFSGGPWGWDATPYRSREYAGDGWLLVGDAASFIDPLSSAGVKKALASAWLAAVVAYTCVNNPPLRTQALAFYAARERDIERRFSDAARLYLSEAAQGHQDAFWSDRIVEVAAQEDESTAVQAAFERLKSVSEFRMRASAAIHIAARPFIAGHEFQVGPHVVTGASDAGTRYLYNVDVPAIIELAPRVDQVDRLLAVYMERHGEVDLHDFLMALSTAVARGWLVSE
jgi:flavin-dependent dehydrogenase